MCKIVLNLTKQEKNWLMAKLNNEFIDSEIAQSILKKTVIQGTTKENKRSDRV